MLSLLTRWRRHLAASSYKPVFPACLPSVPDPPHCGGSGAPPQPCRWSYPCPAVASMSGIRRGTSSSQRCRACALSRRGTRSSSNP